MTEVTNLVKVVKEMAPSVASLVASFTEIAIHSGNTFAIVRILVNLTYSYAMIERTAFAVQESANGSMIKILIFKKMGEIFSQQRWSYST